MSQNQIYPRLFKCYCHKFNCDCNLEHPPKPKTTMSTPKPCLSCGSKMVDPEGLYINGEYRPQCISCGASARSLAFWNDRTHLIDLITNAIYLAIRKAHCGTYNDWQALIKDKLENASSDNDE